MTKKRSIRALSQFPRYGVSLKGVVYRLTKRGSDERLLVPRPLTPVPNKENGYLAVSLYGTENGRVPTVRYVHELMAETYLGPRPEGADIHHRSKDKHDNRAKNLRYVTRVEHRREHADEYRNKHLLERKLTPDDVREIRRRAAVLPPHRSRPGWSGDSLVRMAQEKGVCRAVIAGVMARRTYRDVA